MLCCLVFPQWIWLDRGTFVFLMSGTPASGFPGILHRPRLMDTSLSTSLKVWTRYETITGLYKTRHIWLLLTKIPLFSGSDETMEVLVGDVTSHQLHNLKPGTTYDLKVLAQYGNSLSGPLVGEGTTCKFWIQLFICFYQMNVCF